MRVFVTGSGGHIGSALVAELVGAGHEVLGLVRSDASAAAVAALGATAVRGDVNDLDLLRRTVADVDAVAHLAFDNASVGRGDLTGPNDADMQVVRTLGDALADTGKTLVGVGLASTGSPERDRMLEANPRVFVAREVLSYADRGVRAMLIAIPPVTHSDRDTSGFVPTLVRIARAKGVSGYVAAGRNHWPAAHTLDLAMLYRLMLEQAPAGSQVIGAAEPGIPVREIAEAIGRGLGLPAVSVPSAEAAAHFAPFPFASFDIVMPNEATKELLDWEPTHPGLIADIESGHYLA